MSHETSITANAMQHDELEIVRRLQSRPRRAPCATLGIGDDMAILPPGVASILLAADMLLDGVHFDSGLHSPEQIGRKAAACNLSDCAAMAVRPVAVTASLALPRTMDTADASCLLDAIAATAESFGAELVGGDTNRWSGPLALDVAILATPFEGIAPVTRSRARVGDRVFVSGLLGGSLRGRHMTFTPRVEEARALAAASGEALHAMIDITDGLSLDLWRVCEASRVGAILDEELLHAAASTDACAASAEDGRSVLDHVLSDGEDFELLFCLARDVAAFPIPCFPVGEIVDAGLSLRRRDGTLTPLEPRGYVH